MKKSLSNSILTLLACALLSVFFIGCENFFDGADTRAQLEQLVKEANAPTVDVYMVVDNHAGTVSPTGIINCKLERAFTVLFTPSESSKFIEWQAVDRYTGDPLPDAVVFDDPKKAETKAKVVKEINDIQIVPVYIDYPRVVSYSPLYSDYGSYANTPIKFEFTVPMVNRGSENIFSFDNISILSDGKDMSSYFLLPELSENKKTLTIKPDAPSLIQYMENNYLEILQFMVSLDCSKIWVSIGNREYKLMETDEISFSYSIGKQMETNKPVKVEGTDVIVSRNPFTLSTVSGVTHKYPSGQISTDTGVITKEQINARRISDSIYIYGKYYDANSGVRDLIVEEQYTNEQNGNPVVSFFTTGIIENKEINRDSNGNVEFCLKYTFISSEGAIALRITPVDYCDNLGDSEIYTFIKPGKPDADRLIPYNLYIVNSRDGGTGAIGNNSGSLRVDTFETELRTIKINDNTDNHEYGKFIWYLYGEMKYSYEEISVYCDFDNQGYKKMDYDSVNHIWKKTMCPESVSVCGKSVKIKVADDFGNEAVKQTTFPGEAVISNIVTKGTNDYEVTLMSSETCTGAAKAYINRNGGEYYSYYTINGMIPSEFSPRCNNGISNNYLFFMHNGSLSGPLSRAYSMLNLKSGVFDPTINTIPSTAPLTITSASRQTTGAGTGKTNISISINNSCWDYYDHVYCKYTEPYTSPCILMIPDNQNTLSFAVDTLSLWSQNLPVEVYGIKGNTVYGPATVSVQSFSANKQYDNTKPICGIQTGYLDPDGNWYYISNNYVPDFNFYDTMSGIKEIKWYIVGSNRDYNSSQDFKDLIYDLYEYLPVYDLDEKSVSLKIEVTDNNNNTNSGNFTKIFYDPPALCPQYVSTVNSSTVKYTLTATADKMWYKWKYNICKFINDVDFVGWDPQYRTQNWKKINGYTTNVDSSYVAPGHETSGGTHVFTYNNIQLPKDTFFKIVTFADMTNGTTSETMGEPCYYGFSDPIYFYTGEPSSGDATDYLLPSNNSDLLYFIGSDQPVLVNTIMTKKSLEECKNWDAARWNCRHRTVNDILLSFSLTDRSFKSYYVNPVDIPSGYCYVVVAHFADGSVKLSEVRQMK